LTYLADLIVNGHPTIRKEQRPKSLRFVAPPVPKFPDGPPPPGSAQILDEGGPARLVEWIKRQQRPLLTDTTLRDAAPVAAGDARAHARHGGDRAGERVPRPPVVQLRVVGRGHVRRRLTGSSTRTRGTV